MFSKKTFLTLYPFLENSTTGIAIIVEEDSMTYMRKRMDEKKDDASLKLYDRMVEEDKEGTRPVNRHWTKVIMC